MPAPILLVFGPLLAAVLTYLFQRWAKMVTLIGFLTILILWMFLLVIDLEGPLSANSTWSVLGRELVLTPQISTALLFVYTGMAILFLLNLLIPPGAYFIPLCLAILSPLAAALMIQPVVFGAVLLLIAAGGIAILIQGERAGSTLAALRYLILVALAVPLLLVSDWMLDTDQFQYITLSSGLVLVAFVILLAGFPFHIWVAPSITESQWLVPVVTFGFVQLLIAVFGLNLLADNPSFANSLQYLSFARASGIITVVLASLLAFTALSFGRLLGYLLLLDVGVTVLAISFEGRIGIETTLSLLMMRTAGLILACFGLGLIRRQISVGKEFHNRTEKLTDGRGLAWQTPFGLALFIYGGFSLVGLPLTPGFSLHWAAVLIVADQSPWLAVLIVIGFVIGALGLIRHFPSFLSASQNHSLQIQDTRTIRIAAIFLLIVGFFLALFPQLLIDFAGRLAFLS